MSFEKFLTNMVLQARAERDNKLNTNFHKQENDEKSLSNEGNSIDLDNVTTATVPFKCVPYGNQNYIVIPYSFSNYCLCITENTIMALAIEEEYYVLENSQKTIVVKAELRDPFKQRLMNRKDIFTNLEEPEQRFYYEVFKEARKLNIFFSNHEQWDNIRDELLTLIEDGLLGKRISLNAINKKLQELSGKHYISDGQKILFNDIESNLYSCCKDIYEYR